MSADRSDDRRAATLPASATEMPPGGRLIALLPFPAWLTDAGDGGIRFTNPAADRLGCLPPGPTDTVCRLVTKEGGRIDVELGRSPVEIDGRHLEVVLAQGIPGGVGRGALGTGARGGGTPADSLLRAAVENTGMGIADLDFDTGGFTWSQAFVAQLGHPAVPEGGALAVWLSLMHPEDRPRVVARYEALIASSRTAAAQSYRLRRSDGSDAGIEEQVLLERDHGGRVRRMVMLMAHVEGQESGGRAARLLTEICHDLRQPLNGIELTVDALSMMYREAGRGRAPDAAEVMMLLNGARTSIRVMAALCGQLVDLHALGGGGFVPRPELVRLGPLLEGVCTVHAPLASEKRLRVRAIASPATAVVDPTLLTRALSNLVGNAVENTPSGEVTVRCRRHRGGIRIDVSDTGPGLPVYVPDPGDLLAAAAQATASARLGHGLGLAVVRRCAALMGASVEVAAVPARGTRVSLFLPTGNVVRDREGSTPGRADRHR